MPRQPRGVKRPPDIIISSDDEDYGYIAKAPKYSQSSNAGPSGSAHASSRGGSSQDPIVIPDSPPPTRAAPRPTIPQPIVSRPQPSRFLPTPPPVTRPSVARPVTPPPVRVPPPRVPSPVAPPPVKKARKKKDPNAGPAQAPEKRRAIFKKKCPQAIRERAERVATQRYGVYRTSMSAQGNLMPKRLQNVHDRTLSRWR